MSPVCILASGLLLASALLWGADSYAQSHDAPAAMTFEVATIKPNPHHQGWNMYFTVDGFEARGVTLRQLVQQAYAAFEDGQVLGGPAWLDSDHFDINAKLNPAEVPSFAQLNLAERGLMLQALLTDRFQLKVHRVQRTVPAFALKVAKEGLKIHAAKAGEGAGSSVKGYNCLMTKSGRGLLEGQNCSMADIAQNLKWAAGRIVIDQTGLQGLYDWSLHWTPEDVQGSSPPDSGRADGVQDESYPFFFKALEQELGLKLEPTNTSIDVYVIDRAEQPSDN